MLQPESRIAICAGMLLAGAAAWRFYRKQNAAKALGGRISLPKIAWLFYAVFVWFVLAPAVALDAGVSRAMRWTIGLFAASMWLRGIAEMYMLYVSRNWRPPIGITHDLVCLAQLLGCLFLFRNELAPASAFEAWVLAFALLIVASLVVEIAYAWLFHDAVGGKTTGEKGVWFADDDVKFRRINRLTATFNVPLYGFVLAFLAVTVVGLP